MRYCEVKEHRQKITDLISSQIIDVTKPAIELHSGEVMTYYELVQLIGQTTSALELLNIGPHQRIAFISDNPLTFPLMIGVIEMATLAALDSTWAIQQYREHFQLLGIDCLMTDSENGPAVDAARMLGMGIINFQMMQAGKVDFKPVAEFRVTCN